jgi:hydrogenase expression/formation protein HypE
MQELLSQTVFPLLGGSATDAEDAAVLDLEAGRVAFTTDSFVVRPLFFPGGDIGKLAVCGTVNDLAMRGAKPLYLSLGLIIEEGLPFETLEQALTSVAEWAGRAGVRVVAGDTKVVERGKADGLFINTAGVGVVPEGRDVSITGARKGDALIINGYIGDHGVAVMTEREGFRFESGVVSDCAPLNVLTEAMFAAGKVGAMRDATRGGLGAVLKEMAAASGAAIVIEEGSLPIRDGVRAVCELLGFDPLYIANEGKLVASVPSGDENAVLEAMRSVEEGRDSVTIGRVIDGKPGEVVMVTKLGSRRLIRMPSGEQLPRIC